MDFIVVAGGCKKFCVNGHLAGNCQYLRGVAMTAQKALPPDLIDSLLSGYKNPEDLIGEHGLLKQFGHGRRGGAATR